MMNRWISIVRRSRRRLVRRRICCWSCSKSNVQIDLTPVMGCNLLRVLHPVVNFIAKQRHLIATVEKMQPQTCKFRFVSLRLFHAWLAEKNHLLTHLFLLLTFLLLLVASKRIFKDGSLCFSLNQHSFQGFGVKNPPYLVIHWRSIATKWWFFMVIFTQS